MKKTIGVLLCSVISLVPAGVFGQKKGGDANSMLQVRLLDASVNGRKLRLSWEIRNKGATAVYVYSTFLHGPAAEYDPDDKSVLVVNTSLMHQASVGVNFYPKARFLRLAPGKLTKGILRDGGVPDSLLTGGSKAVMLNVAYGTEIAQLMQALHAARAANQHPANPIVEWQKIARSNVMALQRR